VLVFSGMILAGGALAPGRSPESSGRREPLPLRDHRPCAVGVRAHLAGKIGFAGRGAGRARPTGRDVERVCSEGGGGQSGRRRQPRPGHPQLRGGSAAPTMEETAGGERGRAAFVRGVQLKRSCFLVVMAAVH